MLGTFYRRGHQPQGIVGRSRDHPISLAELTMVPLLTVILMTDGDHEFAVAHGGPNHMGNYTPRRTLSPAASAVLTEAHHQTGYSYRRVAAVLGITHPYWWRLCRGERAPSTHIAFRIIDSLGLDQDTADLLLDECVDRGR